MKLLYPFLFAMCRMSSGLKVNVATRSLCNRVSDALGQASLSIPIVSRKAISTAIIGTFVAFNPMTNSLPAYAANLEASQLFAKAESAIEDNLKDFKILEQDWSTAKKVITENGNLLSKATSSLTTLKTKMTEYDATLVKMLEEDVASNAQIEAEIVLLRESTGTKYAAAEAASAIPAKPSVTAQLFLKAQNEASTLAQDVSSEEGNKFIRQLNILP